ncbi:MAG TPA: hypothetical protein VGM03_06585 [Phycisphaerae bacterium]
MSTRNLIGMTISALVACIRPVWADTPQFLILSTQAGNIESIAQAASADGAVVVGADFTESTGEAFRWTALGGREGLGDLPEGCFGSEALGVSAGGSVVVGYGSVSGCFDLIEAFRWTLGTGMLGLGYLPADNRSRATGVSDDGLVVVGTSFNYGTGHVEAFRWTPDGMQGLGCIPGAPYCYSRASAVTSDGSVIVGVSSSPNGSLEAFRWTAAGMQGLGFLANPYLHVSEARAVSADGSVVVGWSWNIDNDLYGFPHPEAFRWTAADGMQTLGRGSCESQFPGLFEYGTSDAYGVSGDGLVVVGNDNYNGSACGFGPFIWDAAHGIRRLQDVLESDFGLNLGGYTVGWVSGISADGKTIVGSAHHPDVAFAQSFVARLGNTTTGSNVVADLSGGTQTAGGCTISFSETTMGGETALAISAVGPTPPAGFQLGDPPTFYDISTTASYTGTIEVCINYANASFTDETALRLFHFENDAWADVTSSLNTSAHVICGQVSSLSPFVIAEPVPPCAGIEIHAARHTVGSGSNPSSSKAPLVGITVGVYDASTGSCARQQDQQGDGISWQEYAAIVANCTPVQIGITDAEGVATIAVPAGDYVVISHFDSDSDGSLDQYIGVSAGDLQCGQVIKKHLQLLVDAQGNKKPGKTTRLTGSELLIIEPEYIIWDNTMQLYPFVFETIGDWSITTSVTPPEGFVADYPQLSADVNNELEAVQFTITEIGSDPSPTQTLFAVTHNGQQRTVASKVDIRLTPEYASARGFDVTDLRKNGLIVEKRGRR